MLQLSCLQFACHKNVDKIHSMFSFLTFNFLRTPFFRMPLSSMLTIRSHLNPIRLERPMYCLRLSSHHLLQQNNTFYQRKDMEHNSLHMVNVYGHFVRLVCLRSPPYCVFYETTITENKWHRHSGHICPLIRVLVRTNEAMPSITTHPP